ncbi:unnamed protein product [Protopolystoma xenopodis]|uniref:Uncharacterized protein n=1 Tax=Protopolystoma xenopodis TaxID=117903 RepID=A0A448WLI7_9PLAT|nr:unnamed protein product [Protopolystoma xenopodis]
MFTTVGTIPSGQVGPGEHLPECLLAHISSAGALLEPDSPPIEAIYTSSHSLSHVGQKHHHTHHSGSVPPTGREVDRGATSSGTGTSLRRAVSKDFELGSLPYTSNVDSTTVNPPPVVRASTGGSGCSFSSRALRDLAPMQSSRQSPPRIGTELSQPSAITTSATWQDDYGSDSSSVSPTSRAAPHQALTPLQLLTNAPVTLITESLPMALTSTMAVTSGLVAEPTSVLDQPVDVDLCATGVSAHPCSSTACPKRILSSRQTGTSLDASNDQSLVVTSGASPNGMTIVSFSLTLF